MKIQANLNQGQNRKNNVNFKAIYAADSSNFRKLETLIESKQSNRAFWCKSIIMNDLGADLLKKYDSLLLDKGISFTNANKFWGDMFLNKKEEKLVRGINKKIGLAAQNENYEEVNNQRSLLFEELKKIVENAKPVTIKKMKSNVAREESEIKAAKRKTMKNLFA